MTLLTPCASLLADSSAEVVLSAEIGSECLARWNSHLSQSTAQARIAWALDHLPGKIVLSSSFGAQSATLLHMVTQQRPEIPVILVDTGYLFPETYPFADQLAERLKLNLVIARPERTPAWYLARHGELWNQGVEGIAAYNRLHKVEPMQRTLDQLDCGTWIAGLRRGQSSSRAHIAPLSVHHGRYKLHPIFDWSDRQIGQYLAEHDLPYHPLWEQGYVSIGDVHTTAPLGEGMSAEDTRFFGLKRECGLHE